MPELDQLPVRVMAPELTCRVPALVTFPGTLRVLVLRLSVKPKGMVIPAAYARPVIKDAATNIAIRVKSFLNSLFLLLFIKRALKKSKKRQCSLITAINS